MEEPGPSIDDGIDDRIDNVLKLLLGDRTEDAMEDLLDDDSDDDSEKGDDAYWEDKCEFSRKFRAQRTFGPGAALRLALNAGLEVYCNRARRCRAKVPGDPPNLSWPLDDSRVRSFIFEVYYRKTGECLGPGQLVAVLGILEGMAWRQLAGTEPPVSAEEILANEAVARALYDRAAQGEFLGTLTQLWRELSEAGLRDGWLRSNTRWPTSASLFSRETRRLQPELRYLGVHLRRLPRRDKARPFRLYPLGHRPPDPDGETDQPSCQPSCENVNQGNGLGDSDGHDARISLLPTGRDVQRSKSDLLSQ